MRTRWPTSPRKRRPSRIFCCVLSPKPFSSATVPASHAAFERVEVVDLELVVKRLHLLRAQARQAQAFASSPAGSSHAVRSVAAARRC